MGLQGRWWLLLLVVCWPLAFGRVVANISTADVLVANRSHATFSHIVPKALGQVLIKISGNPGLLTLPAVQTALASAGQLVRSYDYYYQTDKHGTVHTFLRIKFDRGGVDRILRSANQAIWSADRPMIFVWLTVQGNQTTSVLASDDDNTMSRALHAAAFRRGIPILLPAMDLQDQSYVNPNPTKGFNQALLSAAAKRYETKDILAGYISKNTEGQWQGQWLLLLNGEPFSWETEAANAKNLVTLSFDDAANNIANQLAMIDNQSLASNVLLKVSGVTDLKDLVRLMSYLQGLTPVTHVAVSDLQGSTVLLEVSTVGGEQELINALASIHNIQAQTAEKKSNSLKANLYYRLK